MIVLLDIKAKLVKIYTDKGLEIVEFEDSDEIADIIGDNKVTYVTKAMETSSKNIIHLVDKISGKSDIISHDMQREFEELDEGVKFLQSTMKGPVCISDIDLVFINSTDCKQIDAEMQEKANNSVQLRQLIKNGTIRILTTEEMRSVVRKETRKKNKELEKVQQGRDQSLDSIIVKDSSPGSAAALADGTLGDAEVMDITSDVLKEPKELTEDEILNGKLS